MCLVMYCSCRYATHGRASFIGVHSLRAGADHHRHVYYNFRANSQKISAKNELHTPLAQPSQLQPSTCNAPPPLVPTMYYFPRRSSSPVDSPKFYLVCRAYLLHLWCTVGSINQNDNLQLTPLDAVCVNMMMGQLCCASHALYNKDKSASPTTTHNVTFMHGTCAEKTH